MHDAILLTSKLGPAHLCSTECNKLALEAAIMQQQILKHTQTDVLTLRREASGIDVNFLTCPPLYRVDIY